MSWRPKDWKSIKQDCLYDPDTSQYEDGLAEWAFEQGAEALLKALKETEGIEEGGETTNQVKKDPPQFKGGQSF